MFHHVGVNGDDHCVFCGLCCDLILFFFVKVLFHICCLLQTVNGQGADAAAKAGSDAEAGVKRKQIGIHLGFYEGLIRALFFRERSNADW